MDDRQLVAALDGDQRDAALAECIRRYGPLVQRTAWRITGDEHIAEDVCQAVFLVLMRKAGQLREANQLGAWLYRVAVLAARKVVEGKGRRQRREQEAGMVAQAQKHPPSKLPTGIDQAITRLPEIYRRVLIGHYLEGRSHADVAIQLGVNEQTVRKRASLGIERLRKSLAGTTSPGLSVAVLTSMLSAEAATASTASLATASVAAIQAAAAGGAATAQATALANLTIKAIFWAKMKLWGIIGLSVTSMAIMVTALTIRSSPSSGFTLPGKDGVWHLAVSPDGNTIAAASFSNCRVWDVATGRTRLAWDQKCSALAFSPDGKLFAVLDDKSINLWKVNQGHDALAAQGSIETGGRENGTAIAFSPDSQTLAVIGGNVGIELWDVTTNRRKGTMGGGEAILPPLVFFPDGKTLASGGGGSVKLWDLASLQERIAIQTSRPVCAIAVNPDGQTLATWTGSNLSLWDPATGRLLTTHNARGYGVREIMAFSPDGKRLAWGLKSAPDSVILWNIAAEREQSVAPGHTGIVNCVAFLTDGKTLASGAWDGTVKLTKLDLK
jgi:RNA polymerase sigma factor (sigma-70 family)